MINSVFIISEFVPDAGMYQLEDNVFWCLDIDPEKKENLQNAYRLFSDSRKYISAFLDSRSAITNEVIINFLPFLFIPSYQATDGHLVVNISGSSGEAAKDVSNLLIETAAKQGLLNLKINIVSPGEIFISREDFLIHYTTLLKSNFYFGNILFYKSNDNKETALLISALKQVELSFEKNNSLLFSIASESLLLRKENKMLVQKITAIEAELNNQKEYTDILRSTHATRRLQQYYTDEYELLPSWYKRFGHIIKVLTGRRTFKSLFNDKVKKYKD